MSMESRKRARKKSIDNRQFLISISNSDLEMVGSLLQIIDIDFKDQDGCTPLHWAVEIGNVKIIDILLKNGAHIDTKNNNNETPVDIAKRMNQLDILNVLETSLHSDIKDNPKVIETTKNAVNSTDQTFSQGYKVSWNPPIHGYIYQLKVLMLFLHRGLSHEYSFRVGTEIKEAKKFDDLVFEYMHGNKKVYRLLQAKHKIDESKKITIDKLLSDPTGDYNLVKYFHSFETCKKDNFFKDGIIKDVIICTNIDFDLSDLKKSDIEIIEVNDKDDILDIKSDEKQPTRYRFTNGIVRRLKSRLKPAVPDDEVDNFLKHLIFAVNQPNEEELGLIVKSEIGREMGFLDTERAYDKLLIKMLDLMSGKGNSMFLSHEEGKTFFNDLKTEMPIWFNIQDPVMSFTGRSEYLENMHKVLRGKLNICISGIGGVGKCELVRKYIANYGHEYDNQVVWINADCHKIAAESFRQLASDKLNICLTNSEGKEKHLSSIITDVYQFFSKGKSLFIFDNAEKYKSTNELDYGIDQFWPCLSNYSTKPYIIVTSRNQKWPKSIETLILEPLKTEEAKELVEKVLTLESEKEKSMIADFCDKLQSLSLALQQAVAYIRIQKENLSSIGSTFEISDYFDRYSRMADELLNSEFPEDSHNSYNKSVFATRNIIFDALKQKEHGNGALKILNIIAYLLPDNIPVELLLIFSTDEVKMSSAIGLLKQYSSVSIQNKTFSIHRLVQQVTRIKLQRQNEEVNILKTALKLINHDNVNYKNLNHILSIHTFSSKHNELVKEYGGVSRTVTGVLNDCGRIDKAQSIGHKTLTLLHDLSQSNIYTQLNSLAIKTNMANCALQKREYAKALEQFQEIDKLQTMIRRPCLTIKKKVAFALLKLGRRTEALKCFCEILDIERVSLGENHPDIHQTKYTIAFVFYCQGKHNEALSVLREIYEVKKKTLGNSDKQILYMKYSIAEVLRKMNRYDESLKIFKEVCIDQEASLPKNHPNILKTKLNIAKILLGQGQLDAALKMFRYLLHIENKRLGDSHTYVVSINVSIACILKYKGDYDKALEIYKDSLVKLQNTLGPMHQYTLEVSSSMANAFARKNQYTDALELYKDILSKQISVLGNAHEKTLQTRRDIVTSLIKLKQYDAALEHSLEVLNNAESTLGKNHPSTLRDKICVGTLYFANNKVNTALTILKQELEFQESNLGKDHVTCKKIRNHIALIHKEQDKVIQMKKQKYDNAIINELFAAIKERDIVRLEQLLKNGTNINSKDVNGRTLLHQAVHVGATNIVKFLLMNGADVNLMNNKPNTSLHIATSKK